MKEAAIMVTGGAGFIGQHVVRLLAAQEQTVVALYHHKLPESLENVYPVCSDMGSAELLAAPLRGVETVIHLAWHGGLAGPETAVSYDPASPGVLPRNAQILKNLLTAMERAGTRRIVFVSASGAQRGAQVPFLQEKYLSEFLTLNSKVPEKVIVRSSVVFGGQAGGDPFLRSIMRVMKFPLYPVPRRRDVLSPVHVKDIAATIVAATQQPMDDEPATVLDVHGGENYAVQDIFRIVSDRCVKGTRIPLPSFLGTSLLPFLEREKSTDAHTPKLSHFLAIGSRGQDETRHANPFVAVVPKKLATFKEGVLE